MSLARRTLPDSPARRGWCPGLTRPMPTGDGLLARVHPPLGILTLPQARAVAEGARLFGNGHIDLTARANLQIRGVSEGTHAPLARLLEAAGLGDVRADGGPQRLTLTNPLAGSDPAETIDVPTLARAVEAAGLAVPGLPAKTLIVVEGRGGVALPEADVFVFAHGSGGVVIAVASEDGPRDLTACAEADAPSAVAALLAAFARTGRRRARDLAASERTALADALRLEGLARVPSPERERDRVRDARFPERPVPSPHSPARERERGGVARTTAPFSPPAGLLRIARDLSLLAIDAPFGRCTAASFERLIEAADGLGAREIRLSPNRGFVLLVRANAGAAAAMARLARDFVVASDDPRRSIAACTGAPACASGATPALEDAARLADAFRPLAAAGLFAHVSGCPKGCARPGAADLTLVGRDGRYGVVIGGAPSDEPAMHLPIEAVRDRIGRAATVGLAAAFAPDFAATGRGEDGRPA